MLSVSVSDLELFRTWQLDEELDTNWLLARFRREESQSAEMLAGEAFHDALEHRGAGDVETLYGYAQPNGEKLEYRFDFNCDAVIELPVVREVMVSKQYGPVRVRGRVDSWGGVITDYKTTQRLDLDRLMEGYPWRYYLDMTLEATFRWYVFVLKEFGERAYQIREAHTLRQKRYPGMHGDCLRLAEEYAGFVRDLGFDPRENS